MTGTPASAKQSKPCIRWAARAASFASFTSSMRRRYSSGERRTHSGELFFMTTFALGSALAGLGGALGIEMLGLDPGFPLKYIVYFLIVVAVGGSGNIKGSLLASLMLGVFDVAGKYYLPQIGAFVIYAVMVVMLIVRPQGFFGRALTR